MYKTEQFAHHSLYTTHTMPAEESRTESFDESVGIIAEKVRVEQEQKNPPLEQSADTEQQRTMELEKIRNELRESYGDTGGTGDNTDDDSDDTDDDAEDSISALEPANLEGAEAANYLTTIPEEYKEPVTELVQIAVQKGITPAITKAQRKNNPYLVDVFHDSLAQLLHQRMQDQGLL